MLPRSYYVVTILPRADVLKKMLIFRTDISAGGEPMNSSQIMAYNQGKPQLYLESKHVNFFNI